MRGDERAKARLNTDRSNSSANRGDEQTRRIVSQYVERQLSRFMSDFNQMRIKLQVLEGERGDANKQAVRREDVSAVNDLGNMTSSDVASPPTAADFNALRQDVEKLYVRLDRIAAALFR